MESVCQIRTFETAAPGVPVKDGNGKSLTWYVLSDPVLGPSNPQVLLLPTNRRFYDEPWQSPENQLQAQGPVIC